MPRRRSALQPPPTRWVIRHPVGRAGVPAAMYGVYQFPLVRAFFIAMCVIYTALRRPLAGGEGKAPQCIPRCGIQMARMATAAPRPTVLVFLFCENGRRSCTNFAFEKTSAGLAVPCIPRFLASK